MSFFNPFDGPTRPVGFELVPEDQSVLATDLAARNRASAKLMAATRLRNVQSVREGLARNLATIGKMDPGARYTIERDIARLDDEAQRLGQTLATIRSSEAQDLRARADLVERG